uniref:Uncharacterized protein n=1 Tax=Anguilla anguilla TaxID=7936 RepID=A0A0E9QIN4_ANGAN
MSIIRSMTSRCQTSK